MSARPKRFLSSYVVTAGTAFIIILLFLSWQQRRLLDGVFQGLKGGTVEGLLLAYSGSLLLVAAQAYTIVKRIGVGSLIGKFGGARLWLDTHITLSTVGFLFVLFHAGFPGHFRYSDLFDLGFAGIATWLLIGAAISGIFGRYLYRNLPAWRRAFGYWKPAHIAVTGFCFVTAVVHMITLSAG